MPEERFWEIVEVIVKPDDPLANLILTGFYTFTLAIFHACRLVQPSNQGDYGISEAIDLIIQSGRVIEAIRMDGWWMDIGFPDDRDEAEERVLAEE